MWNNRSMSLFKLKIILSCLSLFIASSCVDPVEPGFEFQERLVFIEGIASTLPGASFVSINQSAIEFGVYVMNFDESASASFTNVDTDEVVPLTLRSGAYLPPNDFSIFPGERWKLDVVMANGTQYTSGIETVMEPVPITGINVAYDPELEFRELYGGKYVPGHSIAVTFDDPGEEDNYYYWTYRGYENLNICEKCWAGIFREGECQDTPSTIGGRDAYYDYICETDCWRIRFPESIAIFDDKFSNGKTISDFSVGNLLLYTKEDIVVEVQQFLLSPAAFEYYEVLKDIVVDNSRLNAPPPAALIGNMMNPNDSEDFVFGRFSAVATSVSSTFIDRSSIAEESLDSKYPLNLEVSSDPVPLPIYTTAPCSETKYRTAIVPNGWIDQ